MHGQQNVKIWNLSVLDVLVLCCSPVTYVDVCMSYCYSIVFEVCAFEEGRRFLPQHNVLFEHFLTMEVFLYKLLILLMENSCQKHML